MLPDSIVDLFNCGLGEPRYANPAGEARLAVCKLFYLAIVAHCYVLDECPTVTRFFTFSMAVCRLLCLRLVGVPSSAFQLTKSTPQQANQLRLNGFQKFHSSTDDLQRLKIAALSLQLTQHATAVTCQKQECAEGREPTIVRTLLAFAFPIPGQEKLVRHRGI